MEMGRLAPHQRSALFHPVAGHRGVGHHKPLGVNEAGNPEGVVVDAPEAIEVDVVLLQKGPAVQAIPGHVGHLQQAQRQVREAHHPLGLTLADAAQGGIQGGVGLSPRLHIGKARLDDVQVVLLGLGIQPLQGPGQKLVV